MVKTQRVVITPGEPAGIGPDLVVQLAQREWPVELVVCADATLLTNPGQRCSVCPAHPSALIPPTPLHNRKLRAH